MIFAHAAVPVPMRAGSLFAYSVPLGMPVEPGNLAVVPFASRTLPAVVVQVDDRAPYLPTKELLGLVEGAPSLPVERVEVAVWTAQYYRSSVFDALSLFLPPGWQQAVIECALPNAGDSARAGGWVFEWPRTPVQSETLVDLAPNVAEPQSAETPRGGVRAKVVASLRGRGQISAGRLTTEVGCALGTVGRMVKEGWLVAIESPHPPSPNSGGLSQRERRLPHLPRGEATFSPPLPLGEGRGEGSSAISLDAAQSAAIAPMVSALERRSHQVFLLHGVTGSGKTHLYLRLIEQAARLGRQAIVLVSEIAQTPEALNRYAEHFPGRVAALHSGLPDAERWRLWRDIDRGHFDVIVGPRSALFAPLPALGLVVLDEEHEPAYKQEDRAPRYHAREVAIQLGLRFGAVVVLGSATPDVVSYRLAEEGIYRLRPLADRYSGPSSRGWSSGKLPKVEVVDLREELRAGNSGILSRSLQAGLERVLASGEQGILFLNRRGTSTCVMCRDCGQVMKCRRCDVPVVYHRELGELVCHQCNRRAPLPGKCPRCKRNRVAFFGVGTQRVEEELGKLFPSARVLRWDQDIANQRGAHERLHRQFRDHEADLLVGTQMVAKALDYPLVTLVGVVLADITLHLPDFRAAERTFQLLSQVAGRAGRGEAEGRVILQTYSPSHYSIVAASHHDYRAFYDQELAFRRHHSYPPFRRLALLAYSGAGEARARFEALQMRKRLQGKVDELGIEDVDLLGPAPAFHSRVRGRYRWQIVLAGEGFEQLLQGIDLPLGWTVDVDPMSLL